MTELFAEAKPALKTVEIYRLAINRWGINTQLNMLAEEASELTQIALKIQRTANNTNMRNLAEEIADVEICSEQIKDAFQLGDVVKSIREAKLEKLQKLLENTP